MTEPLANARHERFAQLVASGMAASAAYVQAGYTERGSNALASRLIANDSVAARIQSLKAQTARAASVSREELVGRALHIAMGGHIEQPESALSGEVSVHLAPAKPSDQAKWAQLAAKLCGWEKAPEPSEKANKHEVSVTLDIESAKRIARESKR